MNRRQFLKKLPYMLKETTDKPEKQEKSVIRPPYFNFDQVDLCSDCEGYCTSTCEEKIIFRSDDGSPYIKFENRGCTFCGKCSEACIYGVISTNKNSEEKIYVSVHINSSNCFAWHKTICNTCSDVCIYSAVSFKGLLNPQILSYKCTGCGFCFVKCPAQAIEIKPVEEKS